MGKRVRLSPEKAEIAFNYLGKDINKYTLNKKGNYEYYRISISDKDYANILLLIKEKKDVKENSNTQADLTILQQVGKAFTEDELRIMFDAKVNASPIELHEIIGYDPDEDRNIGIILMSDWHADEVVRPETVLNKNEFNQEIAKQRIDTFFFNAVKMISKKPINELIISALGDFVGGFIHPELEQTNSMTPMTGIAFVKEYLLTGLKYIYDSINVPISVICVCGNHGRTTQKMQFANGFEMSYEYFMYKDMENTCKLMGLSDRIKFIIPRGEFAYIDCLGRKLLFCHGHQFKYQGGIGGLFVPMMRWFSKMNQVMPIDKAFIGHYHTSIYTKDVIVNGSIKGYDAFAMGKALPYEEPQQTYVILNEKRGFIFYTPIFCD